MQVQDKILSLSEYSIGINTYQGNIVINLTYPEGWQIINPSDESVKLMRDENNENTYYYACPVDGGENSLSSVFKTIDETVCYNKDLEAKVELLNQKINELEDIFAKHSIDELKKLEFVFKPRKKAAQKKKTDSKTEPVEEPAGTENNTAETNDMDKMIAESISRKNNGKMKQEQS